MGFGGDTIPPIAGTGTIQEITSDDDSVTITNPEGPITDLSVPGASGTVTEITSTDDSVTITNPEGPVVDLSVAGAGGGLSIATMQFAINSTNGTYTNQILNQAQYLYSPATLADQLPVSLVITIPPITVGALSLVCNFNGLGVENIDTTDDEFQVLLEMIVCNADGTEQMVLSGIVTTSGGAPGDSVFMQSTDVSVQSQVGVDLVYDPSTGNVSSTAGGTYGVVAIGSGQPD